MDISNRKELEDLITYSKSFKLKDGFEMKVI
jgi:hypothetical protein